MQFQFNHDNSTKAHFASKKSNSLRLLDIGCGTGYSTKNFLMNEHPSFREIIGIDISKDMIEFAKLHNADDKITYAVADIQDATTFHSSWFGSFDVIFSAHTFHWVPQQEQALVNSRSLLSQDGDIFLKFAIVRLEYMFEAGDMLIKKWNSYIPKNYEMPSPFNRRWNISPWVSVKEPGKCYAEFMKNLGFDVKSCKSTIHHGLVFDRQQFMSTYKGMYPPLVFIPREQHDEFLGDLLAVITELGAFDDFKATAGHVRLSVHAKAV